MSDLFYRLLLFPLSFFFAVGVFLMLSSVSKDDLGSGLMQGLIGFALFAVTTVLAMGLEP